MRAYFIPRRSHRTPTNFDRATVDFDFALRAFMVPTIMLGAAWGDGAVKAAATMLSSEPDIVRVVLGYLRRRRS
jgi:hypothetical protein